MSETERLVPESLAIPSFSRILLATDFSASSAASATFAALLASYYRAFLVVAHVISVDPKADEVTQNEPEIAKAREVLETQLRDFVAATPLGRCKHETVVAQGPVSEVLAAMIEEKHIDLIVLGTRGRSLVGKLLMGSVAQQIFSVAPCPALSVSPRATVGAGLSRILFATDFSPASLKALPYAISLAEISHARLDLMHAPEAAEANSSEIVMGYHQHLSALIPPEHRHRCESDTLVTVGEPSRAILDAAAENGADLIILGAHAYEGVLSHFQVPISIAYRVVAQAPCPVLRVRS
jgi:nucleotide-binding universal stress UspA family protein